MHRNLISKKGNPLIFLSELFLYNCQLSIIHNCKDKTKYSHSSSKEKYNYIQNFLFLCNFILEDFSIHDIRIKVPDTNTKDAS